MSAAVRSDGGPPEITSTTAVRHFRDRDEALSYLQQFPEQIDGQWFMAGWPSGCGLGWLVVRSGWIAE